MLYIALSCRLNGCGECDGQGKLQLCACGAPCGYRNIEVDINSM